VDAGRNRVTVQEAARRLSVTEQAIRKRIKRGTLDAETEAGRVYVYLDEGYEPSRDAVTNPAGDALISGMQARIDSLERSLEAERDANRENRRIIMQQAQNLAAIEAPENDERSSDVEEHPESTEGSDVSPRRPWWRRLFRGQREE
jgi:predicted DNA-binding transcriptional regulator YafY